MTTACHSASVFLISTTVAKNLEENDQISPHLPVALLMRDSRDIFSGQSEFQPIKSVHRQTISSHLNSSSLHCSYLIPFAYHIMGWCNVLTMFAVVAIAVLAMLPKPQQSVHQRCNKHFPIATPADSTPIPAEKKYDVVVYGATG
jgi:hypothetical protein